MQNLIMQNIGLSLAFLQLAIWAVGTLIYRYHAFPSPHVHVVIQRVELALATFEIILWLVACIIQPTNPPKPIESSIRGVFCDSTSGCSTYSRQGDQPPVIINVPPYSLKKNAGS